jgi:NADH dehydrogenase FAD-containing subunit
MGSLLSVLTRLLGGDGSSRQDRVPVVIVGASFAGLAALRILEGKGRGKLDLTVIEPKDHFEYTPGILRCGEGNLAVIS